MNVGNHGENRHELCTRTHARTHAPFAMKPIYREIVADFDRRIAHMQGVRDQVAALAESDDNEVAERRRRRRSGHVKTGGGDQVVLDAIRSGADTLKKIAAEAKVKEFTAGCALRRLLKAKKVRREGATRNLRYLAS
jgi:hypothetical protein